MATRGGSRQGAGRKARWGVPTTVMRVPDVLKEELLEFINQRMEQAANPEPAAKEPWHGETRCQAQTMSGRRCKISRNLSIIQYQDHEVLACPQHVKRFEHGCG